MFDVLLTDWLMGLLVIAVTFAVWHGWVAWCFCFSCFRYLGFVLCISLSLTCSHLG